MASRPPAQTDTLAALRALGYNRVPKAATFTRGQTRSLEQIVDSAPSLAQLANLARDGQKRLQAISSLLPASLRTMVESGGIEGDAWCLLVPHSAAAAKLRQLLPALSAHLRTRGWNVQSIRVKVKSKN
jgi:Dna[CI] antecedent, DciA